MESGRLKFFLSGCGCATLLAALIVFGLFLGVPIVGEWSFRLPGNQATQQPARSFQQGTPIATPSLIQTQVAPAPVGTPVINNGNTSQSQQIVSSGFLSQLYEDVSPGVVSINVLINNAAVFIKSPLGSVTEKIWEDLFAINLKAGFFLAQEIGPLMKQKGSGKIINIADTSALKPFPSFIPYSLTKSGMISLTKGLAKTLAPEVQVNAINPGPVLLPEYYTENDRQRSIEKTLLQREGEPKDIAEAVKFLLIDGDYITGSTIAVDGGRSLFN